MNIMFDFDMRLPSSGSIEIVERKGIGHPDTVADAIAEKISIEYSKYCKKNFGAILHHNVDKVVVMGGLTEFKWGKGKMIKPVRVLVNGRMSTSFGGNKIPIHEIEEKAVKEQISKALPLLDIKKMLKIEFETTNYTKNRVWFQPRDLDDVPDYSNPTANDTATIVSYWPLTSTEQVTLTIEGFFYDKNSNSKFKFIGTDIKILTIRKGNVFDITMCVPFLVNEIDSFNDYKDKLTHIYELLLGHAKVILGNSVKINLYINTQDQKRIKNNNNVKAHYITVTGTSLDFGEEGVVGRGNNRTGVIPSFRPYSMEASWGKNPVYHVGKILAYVADSLTKTIANALHCHTEIIITTRNGDPLFQPHNIVIRLSKKNDIETAEEITKQFFSRTDWTEKLITDEAFIPKPEQI